jgi:hypothetical protein
MKNCARCNAPSEDVWCHSCYLEVYGEDYLSLINKKYTNPRKKKQNPDKQYYWDIVRFLTSEVSCFIPGINRRGYRSFHLDHKISISYGFSNGIPAEYIAHPSNLWMIWWEENRKKGPSIFVDHNNSWILSRCNLDIQNTFPGFIHKK